MAYVSAAAAAIAATVSLTAIPLVTGGEGQVPATQPANTQTMPVAAPAPRLAFCGEREAMVADLNTQFREQPVARGLVDEKSILEIFVSDNGSWTILATGTDGKSCVMAVGEGFEPTTTGVTA